MDTPNFDPNMLNTRDSAIKYNKYIKTTYIIIFNLYILHYKQTNSHLQMLDNGC